MEKKNRLNPNFNIKLKLGGKYNLGNNYYLLFIDIVPDREFMKNIYYYKFVKYKKFQKKGDTNNNRYSVKEIIYIKRDVLIKMFEEKLLELDDPQQFKILLPSKSHEGELKDYNIENINEIFIPNITINGETTDLNGFVDSNGKFIVETGGTIFESTKYFNLRGIKDKYEELIYSNINANLKARYRGEESDMYLIYLLIVLFGNIEYESGTKFLDFEKIKEYDIKFEELKKFLSDENVEQLYWCSFINIYDLIYKYLKNILILTIKKIRNPIYYNEDLSLITTRDYIESLEYGEDSYIFEDLNVEDYYYLYDYVADGREENATIAEKIEEKIAEVENWRKKNHMDIDQSETILKNMEKVNYDLGTKLLRIYRGTRDNLIQIKNNVENSDLESAHFFKTYLKFFKESNLDYYIKGINEGDEMKIWDEMAQEVSPLYTDESQLGGGGDFNFDKVVLNYALTGSSSLNIPGLTSQGSESFSRLLIEYVGPERLFNSAKKNIENFNVIINEGISEIKNTEMGQKLLRTGFTESLSELKDKNKKTLKTGAAAAALAGAAQLSPSIVAGAATGVAMGPAGILGLIVFNNIISKYNSRPDHGRFDDLNKKNFSDIKKKINKIIILKDEEYEKSIINEMNNLTRSTDENQTMNYREDMIKRITGQGKKIIPNVLNEIIENYNDEIIDINEDYLIDLDVDILKKHSSDLSENIKKLPDDIIHYEDCTDDIFDNNTPTISDIADLDDEKFQHFSPTIKKKIERYKGIYDTLEAKQEGLETLSKKNYSLSGSKEDNTLDSLKQMAKRPLILLTN